MHRDGEKCEEPQHWSKSEGSGGKKGGRFGGALTKSVEMGSWGLVSSPDLCLALVSSLPVTSEHHPPAARGYRLSMGKRLGDGPVERV